MTCTEQAFHFILHGCDDTEYLQTPFIDIDMLNPAVHHHGSMKQLEPGQHLAARLLTL